jgi:hypothetical protein
VVQVQHAAPANSLGDIVYVCAMPTDTETMQTDSAAKRIRI